MRPNTAPKFQDKPLTAEVHRKMILSFEECTSLPERELKCPYCSHYIETEVNARSITQKIHTKPLY